MFDSEIIDSEIIAELRSESEELLQDLLALFISETAVRLRALVNGTGSGDYKVAERAAHTLKSSSATLGATLMSAAAAAVENAARAGDLEELARLLEPLRFEADRAIQEFSEQGARCANPQIPT